MKRKNFSSSSSSSSSSCIESLITENDELEPVINPGKKPKSKRVRASKNLTSAKSRSSIYRGVTRHRWTGRYESHLWDKTTWNNIQNKRGRQIYLGAYDDEEDAARTYDLAALKYWGPASILNFPLESYTKEIEEMQKLSKEEYLASLRRQSSGFSRGVSKYRGVARHHHNGRWEARIGRVCGNKYLYLGTYGTQEEAAAAYDLAAIEFRGPNAVTNFHISHYAGKSTKIPPEGQLINPEDVQVKSKTNTVQTKDVQEHEDYVNQFFQPNTPTLDCIDSQSIAVMDPTTMDHEHHPWDLCLDTGFDIFQIPDIPMEETLDEFDYGVFEDNIECIFDEPYYDNDFLPDLIFGCKPDEDVFVGPHAKEQDGSIFSETSNVQL